MSETSWEPEITIIIINQDGEQFTANFVESSLIENVKNRAIDHFYTSDWTLSRRFGLVKVDSCVPLRDMLNLLQEGIVNNAELLLIERAAADAGELWDAGAIRAPPAAVIAATTAASPPVSGPPPPPPPPQQPDLQALLGNDEITADLRKVLISVVEASARLAAAGRRWEETLQLLSKALDKPPPSATGQTEVTTLETIAERQEPSVVTTTALVPERSDVISKRAKALENFLDKFHHWCQSVAPKPTEESKATIQAMGFEENEVVEALKCTGCNEAAAVLWLVGDRSESLTEVIKGLPKGVVLDAVLKQPQVQRILLNTRMILAFISMLAEDSNVSLWMRFDSGKITISQILKVYHSEKYCQAVNQFSPP